MDAKVLWFLDSAEDRTRRTDMSGLSQDLWHALRELRSSPGCTAVAVLTLALSTAASIVVFSILDPVLVRPSPYRDPSRLVVIWSAAIRQQGRYVWFSSPVPAPTSVVFLPLKFALGRHRSCAFC
jgi:hypothetical protein